MTGDMFAPPPRKWSRLIGTHREDLRYECVRLYTDEQMSIRELVEHTGRSYGFIHRLLAEGGVEMRPRGNPQRT